MVWIPDSVTKIGYQAFGECENLELATLPPNIEHLEHSTFAQCKMLTMRHGLPKNLKTIGSAAFAGCVNLEFESLPDGLKRIEIAAFSRCCKLALTFLPPNLVIEERAFNDCKLSLIHI